MKGRELKLDSFLGKEEGVKELSEEITETLPELPEGWKWVKLGDICKISAGGTPRRSVKEYWNGDIPWVKISDIPDDGFVYETEEKITKEGLENSSAKILPKGTILFTIFATIGKVGLLCIDAATNQAIASIQILKDDIDTKYLFYCLRQLGSALLHIGRGAAQYNVNQTILKNLKVPLPPLDVQKCIVARIEEITSRIEQAKKLREEALKETEKIMQTILYQTFKDPEQKGWKINTLEEVAEIQSNSIQSLDSEKLYNYISLEHIESNTGRLINFAPTPGKEIKSSKVVFTKEHVLYGKLRPYLNKVFVPNFDGICTAELVPLFPKKDLITKEFLAWQLRSPHFVNYAMSNLTGTRMPRMSMDALKNANIAVPSIDEQNCIVTLLDKLQDRITEIRERQKETTEKIEVITQTILKKVFKGEL